MGKLFLLLTAVVATSFAMGVNAAPITENWTSNRNVYDVHACGQDRFIIERQTSVSKTATANFTVYPGDVCLKTTGERSEVVLGGWESTSRFKVLGDEGTEYYRVSVKLAPNWKHQRK